MLFSTPLYLRKIFNSLQVIYEMNYRSVILGQSETLLLVQGLNNVKDLVELTIESAYDKLDVAITFKELLDYDILSKIIDKSKQCSVRLLIDSSIQDLVKDLPPRIDVKVKNNMFGSGFISSCVTLVMKYRDNFVALHSNNKYILDIAMTYFNHLWRTT